MKTLKVTLKQHTPLIHFQHEQDGATLRASEVKPKLDRFLLGKLGGGDYSDGIKDAKNRGWLIGKGEHPALDYKLKIIPEGKIVGMSLQKKQGPVDQKWTTEDFPLLLANMGERNSNDELVNFSMYKSVIIHLTCIKKEDLYKELMEQFPYFIANTNFGQRSNKGFGSFTIEYIEDCNGNRKKINIIGDNPYYIPADTLYMDFCLEEGVDDDQAIGTLEKQKIIFKVIETYWMRLRNAINRDTSVGYTSIDSVKAYIKGMKYIKVDEKNLQRMPAPVMFKPISYINQKNLNVSVYIMFDAGMLDRLKEQYRDKLKINDDNKILVDEITDLNYIDEFSKSIIHHQYGNLRINLEKEKIDVKFYGQ